MDEITWKDYEAFLIGDLKIKATKKNLLCYSSRFNLFQKAFAGLELNRVNLVQVTSEFIKKGVNPAHVNNYIKVAKHLAKMKGITELYDYSFYKEKEPEVNPLTVDEMQRLAAVHLPYKRDNTALNYRDFAAINLLGSTGCRSSELKNLLWRDVRNSPTFYIIFRDTKNGDDRTVTITKRIYDLLMELPRFGERVFDSKAGKEFDSTEFNRNLKERAKIAKIDKPVYLHIFRHSYLTIMTNETTTPITNITKLVGHRSPETTMRYSHPSLVQLSATTYANPLESNDAPLTLTAPNAKDAVAGLYDKKKFNVFLEKVSETQAIIRIDKI